MIGTAVTAVVGIGSKLIKSGAIKKVGKFLGGLFKKKKKKSKKKKSKVKTPDVAKIPIQEVAMSDAISSSAPKSNMMLIIGGGLAAVLALFLILKKK